MCNTQKSATASINSYAISPPAESVSGGTPTTTHPAVSLAAATTVFRMLTDYFGDDERKAIQFMQAFAGVHLKVPPIPVVERIARDRQVVAALDKDPSTPVVRRLAQLHGQPMRAIAKTFSRQKGHGLKHVRQQRAGK
jgi:hypothetical protein